MASVAVNPGTASLAPQQTQQLAAVVRDAQGNTLSGRTVTWSSDAQSVATVSTSGLVTAVAAGTARITATSEGQSGSATLTVVNGVQVGPTGGTFTFEDGAVTVAVPAGAVTTPTVVTVARVTTPAATAPAGWQRVGPVYALGPAGVAFS
ncbi:MAG: Ig-like domain-containing protein, partial [Gemmatimonadales bacterium]